MQTITSFKDFDVAVYETSEWNYNTHKHTFFEIIYILEGEGIHILNDNSYHYQRGSLYVLTPSDYHSFRVDSLTRFCIITFNEIYFKSINDRKEHTELAENFKKIDIIFNNASSVQGNIIFSDSDAVLISILINKLIKENNSNNYFNQIITQSTTYLLLNLIAQNVQEQISSMMSQKKTHSEIYDFLLYIQKNIYNKEKLKTESIADHFCKSSNYVSEYFKFHSNQTIKEYIVQYKLNLVKRRLLHSNHTISQIADELGFTDESHLNKTFKQYFNQTAKEYKKNHAMQV